MMRCDVATVAQVERSCFASEFRRSVLKRHSNFAGSATHKQKPTRPGVNCRFVTSSSRKIQIQR